MELNMSYLFKLSCYFCITLIAVIESKKNTSMKHEKRVIFTKIEQEINKNMMSMNIQITNNSNGIPTVDLDSELFEDIPKELYVETIISERVSEMDFNALVKTGKINLCIFFKIPNREPFLKIVLGNLEKYGHMMFSCPVKKGKYYLKDFSMDANTLPWFTPAGDYRIDTTVSKKVNDVYVLVFKTCWFASIMN